jgi:glycosyltransferase involved in cell wall biosynthesis
MNAQLMMRSSSAPLACDHRNISNFAALWKQLSHWNIRDQVIYLGLVPHEDVLRLVRQAICVVNPSRFEGWGITVDEARSVGKQVIASNLASHMEQNPDKALYFDPRDQRQLTDLLEQGWKILLPGPDLELEKQARLDLPRRLRTYAQEFLAISQEAIADLRIQ